MRFLTVPLKIKVTQNTGLTVPYASNVIITTANLSATTNVPLQHLELRYRLTKQPTFGKIQRLQHGVEVWTEVDTFTQRHLNSSRLRYAYVSEDFTAAEDEFSFVISARDKDTETQTFRINFSPVSLNVETNNRLLVKQVPYGKLENSTLLVAGDAGQVDTSRLTFTLLRPPKFGAVFLSSEGRIFSPLDFDTLRPMETGDSFTQADVDSGRVYFKFDHTGFDRLEDYMDLTVKYPSSSGRMLRAWVEYVPLDTAVRFTNNGLRDVAEGGRKVISRAQLYLQMDGYKDFRFSVINSPRHGNLSFLDPRSSSVLEEQVEDFTTADIREGKLTYMHDDSENDQDFFIFAAVPIFTSEEEMPEEIQEFSGTFHISMAMRNDNPPERVVDKVFHVMRNGQKTLTLDDLAFTDKDIHYDSSELQYRRQNIPNGEILMADTGEPVYQFKQKDLKEGRLVFHHRLVIQSNLS
jgi:chondroitin sulfate proteoglycan 4